MGITLSSLERQLVRHDRPVSELLREMAHHERQRERRQAVAS
jgi:hypothetical protein